MRTGIFIALVLTATTTVAVATPSVTVSSTANASALVLDGQGSSSTHVVKIADVALWTDASNGLTLFISSGTLSKAGGTSIAFEVLLVDDGASAPLSSAFTTPSGTTYSWSSTSAGAVDKDLYIKYTPAPLQDPGVYAASVDLDLIDN